MEEKDIENNGSNLHQGIIIGIFSGLVISWVVLFSNFLTNLFFPKDRLIFNIFFSFAIAIMFIFVILFLEKRFLNKIKNKKDELIDLLIFLLGEGSILLIIIFVIYLLV
jgi:hypothetical protein